MIYDIRGNSMEAFLRAEAAYLTPPEPRECECDPDDDDCMLCLNDKYDEDYMKDPDRARDERIDREMDEEYWRDKYEKDACLD